MARPCGHTVELEPGQPYENGSCRLCWLYYNHEGYRTKWDGETQIRNSGGQTADPSAKFRFTGDRKCNCKDPNKPELLPSSGTHQSEKAS